MPDCRYCRLSLVPTAASADCRYCRQSLLPTVASVDCRHCRPLLLPTVATTDCRYCRLSLRKPTAVAECHISPGCCCLFIARLLSQILHPIPHCCTILDHFTSFCKLLHLVTPWHHCYILLRTVPFLNTLLKPLNPCDTLLDPLNPCNTLSGAVFSCLTLVGRPSCQKSDT